MAILDSQGRLFNRLSILDVGAALVILLVIFGIFFYPGSSGSVAQVGVVRKPVEVDVVVRGLSAAGAKDLIKEGQKANIIVRKQPSGEAVLKAVKFLPRNTLVPQPDGSVKALPDPRPEMAFSNDMILTLGSNAQIAEERATKQRTPILGGEKVKVGMPLELDGPSYNFSSSVISVRIKD
jgi:Domain of unknown function (DUF4330)